MSRKGIKAKQRKRITYDIRYTDNPADVNRDIAKFINVVMLDGKKSVAERIVFSAFEIISAKTKDDPVKTFEKAISNVRPRLEVRARRVGGGGEGRLVQPARRGEAVDRAVRIAGEEVGIGEHARGVPWSAAYHSRTRSIRSGSRSARLSQVMRLERVIRLKVNCSGSWST